MVNILSCVVTVTVQQIYNQLFLFDIVNCTSKNNVLCTFYRLQVFHHVNHVIFFSQNMWIHTTIPSYSSKPTDTAESQKKVSIDNLSQLSKSKASSIRFFWFITLDVFLNECFKIIYWFERIRLYCFFNFWELKTLSFL